VIYASTAALIKDLTNIVVRHPLQIVTSWPLYAVIVLGVVGVLLSQIAFQSGPLTASLPPLPPSTRCSASSSAWSSSTRDYAPAAPTP